MAEQQQPNASAAFPAPPPFYKHFTADNLAQLKQLRASNREPTQETVPDAPTRSPPPLDITSLPAELRYLIPPPPPTGQYRSFGTINDATPLSPNTDSKAIPDPRRLKALVHRILLEFLALTQIMATDPGGQPPAWALQYEALKAVFVEAHGVLNEFRPHQARETLIEMMEEQVRRGKEEIKLCEEAKVKVRDVLSGLGKVAEVPEVKETASVERQAGRGKRKLEAQREDENRNIWKCLHREVGRI